MSKWKFTEIPRIESISFNPILERFYKAGIEGLIRENIQNSLDARLNENEPAKVTISLEKIVKSDIPGHDEIVKRIESLKGQNSYTNETISNMQDFLNAETFDVLVFEDSNTKGLKGARFGQTNDNEHSYSSYAYQKGAHFSTEDAEKEKLRGGSHGIGKIASNSASQLYTMFFANNDENNFQTLGGTIQLIEHNYQGRYYRETGYFTDEIDGKFFPYENTNFHKLFKKESRGLKIIIPYFRGNFKDEDAIVRTVCDSFLLALKRNELIVDIHGIIISNETIEKILNNKQYFSDEIIKSKQLFTKLYWERFNHLYEIDFVIEDSEKAHHFELFFTYDESIEKGRTGIFRNMGMKIQDYGIQNYKQKPYNAVLIPKSSSEDALLKSLENESHTSLSHEHFKDETLKNNAKKFIKNLEIKIAEVIDLEIKKHIENEGKLDTSDLIYEIQYEAKQTLKKSQTEVLISDGESVDKVIKTDSTDILGKNKSKKRNKTEGGTDAKSVKKTFGDDSNKRYYQLPGSSIKRFITNHQENIIIHVNNENMNNLENVNLLFSIVDGMGVEHTDELDLTTKYVKAVDLNTDTAITIDKFSLNNVSIIDNKISIICLQNKDVRHTDKIRIYIEE
jgi:antitoxin component of RelBE/YafQ-DinJ toxin-antitoxin module